MCASVGILPHHVSSRPAGRTRSTQWIVGSFLPPNHMTAFKKPWDDKNSEAADGNRGPPKKKGHARRECAWIVGGPDGTRNGGSCAWLVGEPCCKLQPGTGERSKPRSTSPPSTSPDLASLGVKSTPSERQVLRADMLDPAEVCWLNGFARGRWTQGWRGISCVQIGALPWTQMRATGGICLALKGPLAAHVGTDPVEARVDWQL